MAHVSDETPQITVPLARDRGSRRFIVPLLLLFLFAFHFAANRWYLAADNHVIRTDEETHMLTAREYYEVFALREHESWLTTLIDMANVRPSNPAHPPLLPILGAALATVLGYGPDTFALVNSFMFLLLVLGCFLLARRFLDEWHALFAAVVVSLTPSLFHASRFFMTDYPATVITVWAVYALIRSDYFRNTGWVTLFAVLTGLGILVRTITFLYYIVPAALIVAVGLFRARHGGLRGILLNCAITVLVSAGLFSPWYFHNLDVYYDYWVHKHAGGTGGPLTISGRVPTEEHPEAAPETRIIAAASEAEISPAGTTPETPQKRPVIARRLPWIRYPVHVINNNLFVPLSVLAALGAVIVLVNRRFRGPTTALMLVWIGSSYVLMTVLIKYSVARYALPVVPALGLLAALPVIALPWPVARRIAGAALCAWLLFQYGNLTFTSYGAAGRAYLPGILDAVAQNDYDDPGLALYKDTLTYGFSYSGLGAAAREDYQPSDEPAPVARCNYKERLFRAMVAAERARAAASGPYANYVRLGREMRGMELEERHYWPAPNPFLLPGTDPATLPARRLKSIGMATDVNDLISSLPQADYVVYALPESQTDKEQHWRRYVEERGFKLVDRFRIARFGCVPAQTFGLFSRAEEALVAIGSREDIDRLTRIGLYELIHSVSHANLTPDLQTYTRDRFRQQLEQAGFPASTPLNESLTYIGADVVRIDEKAFQFWFTFYVNKKMDRNWRVYLHGVVRPEDRDTLPEDKRDQGFFDWNFNPEPPTSEWPEGDYIMITRTIIPEAIPYQFRIGFFTNEDGGFGRDANIGVVDFSRYLGAAPATP